MPTEEFLEDHADRENVQEHIRREIQRGTIRVIPRTWGHSDRASVVG